MVMHRGAGLNPASTSHASVMSLMTLEFERIPLSFPISLDSYSERGGGCGGWGVARRPSRPLDVKALKAFMSEEVMIHKDKLNIATSGLLGGPTT
ncbi:hypothetical protein B296_00019255 [Ensete ventricosum]|uniref:Uncharacterized protein n=1 Tax=Ensete ventricosum TaxID=4639 RepID=A0A427AJ00_ENSVE|nr:hypothetical protein B296_00019255 [Ensete ventricosum]